MFTKRSCQDRLYFMRKKKGDLRCAHYNLIETIYKWPIEVLRLSNCSLTWRIPPPPNNTTPHPIGAGSSVVSAQGPTRSMWGVKGSTLPTGHLFVTHKSVGGCFFVQKSDARVAIGAEPTPLPPPVGGGKSFLQFLGRNAPKTA